MTVFWICIGISELLLILPVSFLKMWLGSPWLSGVGLIPSGGNKLCNVAKKKFFFKWLSRKFNYLGGWHCISIEQRC